MVAPLVGLTAHPIGARTVVPGASSRVVRQLGAAVGRFHVPTACRPLAKRAQMRSSPRSRSMTRTLAEPKTERSRRMLRLPGAVCDALREHRRRQLGERLAGGSRWVDGDFVFATRQGRPMVARNVLRDFHARLAEAGLPRQQFHDLRHCYATMMLEDGEDLAVVSRSLGHSQLETTADVYAHLTPAMLERTAARMDGVLTRHKRASGA